ncbi:hypothetical protein IAT38_001589 [Cryptococcus sp. DSM 104549]
MTDTAALPSKGKGKRTADEPLGSCPPPKRINFGGAGHLTISPPGSSPGVLAASSAPPLSPPPTSATAPTAPTSTLPSPPPSSPLSSYPPQVAPSPWDLAKKLPSVFRCWRIWSKMVADKQRKQDYVRPLQRQASELVPLYFKHQCPPLSTILEDGSERISFRAYVADYHQGGRRAPTFADVKLRPEIVVTSGVLLPEVRGDILNDMDHTSIINKLEWGGRMYAAKQYTPPINPSAAGSPPPLPARLLPPQFIWVDRNDSARGQSLRWLRM